MPEATVFSGHRELVEAGSTRILADDGDPILVHRGLVVVRALNDRQQVAYVQLRRGPCYVALERLTGGSQRYELMAITNLDIEVVPLSSLEELRDRLPDEGRALVDLLAAALDDCVGDRVAMSGSTQQRVARLVLAGQDGGVRVNRVPRLVWADVLGMRPETLSRSLLELAEQGLITVDRDHVTVQDREGLAALLESAPARTQPTPTQGRAARPGSRLTRAAET